MAALIRKWQKWQIKRDLFNDSWVMSTQITWKYIVLYWMHQMLEDWGKELHNALCGDCKSKIKTQFTGRVGVKKVHPGGNRKPRYLFGWPCVAFDTLIHRIYTAMRLIFWRFCTSDAFLLLAMCLLFSPKPVFKFLKSVHK